MPKLPSKNDLRTRQASSVRTVSAPSPLPNVQNINVPQPRQYNWETDNSGAIRAGIEADRKIQDLEMEAGHERLRAQKKQDNLRMISDVVRIAGGAYMNWQDKQQKIAIGKAQERVVMEMPEYMDSIRAEYSDAPDQWHTQFQEGFEPGLDMIVEEEGLNTEAAQQLRMQVSGILSKGYQDMWKSGKEAIATTAITNFQHNMDTTVGALVSQAAGIEFSDPNAIQELKTSIVTGFANRETSIENLITQGAITHGGDEELRSIFDKNLVDNLMTATKGRPELQKIIVSDDILGGSISPTVKSQVQAAANESLRKANLIEVSSRTADSVYDGDLTIEQAYDELNAYPVGDRSDLITGFRTYLKAKGQDAAMAQDNVYERLRADYTNQGNVNDIDTDDWDGMSRTDQLALENSSGTVRDPYDPYQKDMIAIERMMDFNLSETQNSEFPTVLMSDIKGTDAYNRLPDDRKAAVSRMAYAKSGIILPGENGATNAYYEMILNDGAPPTRQQGASTLAYLKLPTVKSMIISELGGGDTAYSKYGAMLENARGITNGASGVDIGGMYKSVKSYMTNSNYEADPEVITALVDTISIEAQQSGVEGLSDLRVREIIDVKLNEQSFDPAVRISSGPGPAIFGRRRHREIGYSDLDDPDTAEMIYVNAWEDIQNNDKNGAAISVRYMREVLNMTNEDIESDHKRRVQVYLSATQ